MPPSRLEAAGWMGGDQSRISRASSSCCARRASTPSTAITASSIAATRCASSSQIDVFSMPAPYKEPKGLLGARGDGRRRAGRAAGARRVPEMVLRTGGGVLVNPDDAEAWRKGSGSSGRIAMCARGSGVGALAACASTTRSRAWPTACRRSTKKRSTNRRVRADGGATPAAPVTSEPSPRGDIGVERDTISNRGR